jgi:hypothetical protein
MKPVLTEDEKDFVAGLKEILDDLRIEADTDETEKGIVFNLNRLEL